MFGGAVPPAVDSRWCSHASVPKTALQLLGLPALGVPRVDDDADLANLVATTAGIPPPPAVGTPIALPAPPTPPRTPNLVPPSRVHADPPRRSCCAGGGTLPAPNDITLKG